METNALSEREIEILKLVGQGKSNKEIAENLFISVNTVKVHLTSVFRKTGVTSRTEATLYAIEHGYIDSPRGTPDDVQILISQPGETSTTNPSEIGSKQKTNWMRMFWLALALISLYFVLSRSSLFSNNTTQTNPLTQSLSQARWRTLRPMTTSKARMAAVVYENAIYLIGGENEHGVLASVDKYDVASNAYTTLAKKPTPVTDAGAVVIGGKIYVPGGQDSEGSLTDVLEVYDPRNDTWSVGKSLPNPLSRYAVATLEGTLFLFGGWDGQNTVNTVLSYNPASDTWKTLSPFTAARSDAQAAVLGDRIFLVGGTHGSESVREIEVYAPTEDAGSRQAWSSQIALPADMEFLGCQTLSGSLFVLGKGENGALDLMQFTPQNNAWFTYAEVPPEPLLSETKVVGLGGDVYFLGGKADNSTYSNLVQKYQAVYTIVLPSISK